jgi:ProP effector
MQAVPANPTVAVGIHDAILADLGCDPTILSRALSYWCASARYRLALCSNDERYGLDGQPCGEVTAEQRQHAREQLGRRGEVGKRG